MKLNKNSDIKKLQWRLIAILYFVFSMGSYHNIYAYTNTENSSEATASNEAEKYKDSQSGLTCKEVGEYAKWAMNVWQYDAPMIDFLMSRTPSQKKVALLAIEYSSTFPKNVDKWHKNHYVNKAEVDFSVWCKSGFLWALPEKLKSR
ncbi:hypothetical protein MKFW12EY_02620 [Methylomonas koyamae]|nr:hypothetical protein MKFW12EY_02620 [Methylomonas koyamae]